MQAALVSVAASPVTLLVIGIADFSKHATPEVLRVMRDEVRSYLLLPSLLLGLCKAYMGFAGVYMQGCKQMYKQSTFFTAGRAGGRRGGRACIKCTKCLLWLPFVEIMTMCTLVACRCASG